MWKFYSDFHQLCSWCNNFSLKVWVNVQPQLTGRKFFGDARRRWTERTFDRSGDSGLEIQPKGFCQILVCIVYMYSNPGSNIPKQESVCVYMWIHACVCAYFHTCVCVCVCVCVSIFAPNSLFILQNAWLLCISETMQLGNVFLYFFFILSFCKCVSNIMRWAMLVIPKGQLGNL